MSERRFIPPHERRRPIPGPKARIDGKTGGASPYQLGRRFEYSCRGRLERRDYFVMRAHGSKGKIDLLAVGLPCLAKGVTGLYIQCKRLSTRDAHGEVTVAITSAEWNEVYEIATKFGGWPVIATRISERTTGFYRIDAPREPRKPGRPWTLFDPADLSELTPPPTLIDPVRYTTRA